MVVDGVVASGYEPVRTAFTRLFDEGRESGASLSVWAGGEEVVSLTGGWADSARSRPWQRDTLVHTYSTSKPFAALAALTAVADGKLALDEPVSDHWAEYGSAGKDRTTLRQILTHRAGLPAFPQSAEALDLLDEDGLRQSLAAAPAETPPGSTLAEHALTYGHLIDGVLRASTGRSLGQTYADIVQPALGGFDAWFGVREHDLGRVAELEHAITGGFDDIVAAICPTYHRTLAVPTGALDLTRINSAAFRQSVFGAMNLHASATALASFYARLTSADGPVRRLLGERLHDEYLATQVCGHDATGGKTVNWTLGFLRTEAFIGLGGLGGSAAWWSWHHDHAVAYVTRRLHDHSRVAEIAAALGDNLNIEVTCR